MILLQNKISEKSFRASQKSIYSTGNNNIPGGMIVPPLYASYDPVTNQDFWEKFSRQPEIDILNRKQ
ncbi:LOW QUALITY PROTEIN: hypothetical protein V1477_020739 [Vespula maculifrons]|uniref:Uncharacterized protein n=1 Tax=Vespula maculifrons TaxID=7453 RepID=A0ABD2AMR9_VESMC